MCVYIHIYVYTDVHTLAYVLVFSYMQICVCKFVCTCLYIYVSGCIHIYVYSEMKAHVEEIGGSRMLLQGRSIYLFVHCAWVGSDNVLNLKCLRCTS